jgi:hypothetical protein
MANLSSLFGNTPFNPAAVEEVNTDFSPLPKGEYLVQITDSEIAQNKSGTGTNLTLKLVVQDGKYKNRMVFENLCVVHQNQTAQGIAQTRLKQICEALKVKALKDTSQIHDKNLVVSLDVEKDKYMSEQKGTDEWRNAIKGYRAAKVATPEPAQASEEFEDDIPF